MSKEKRIFLNSGGRPFTLPSGDEGVYVDLCLEDLEEIVKEFKAEEIKRPWINKRENKTYNNIRIFVIPKKESSSKASLYPYYLEVARALNSNNEEDD